MADLRKTLTKLKVIELKEKLQELGKIPKGLKADLINQLADAYEEQQKAEIGGHSAPHVSYPTPAVINELPTNESQHYYQQSVPQYSMPGQQVYEQTAPYIQTPYEQQYQYPTHPVFSPTHEQQYTQSSAQYQMTSPLSPRINTQLSPQMSPQMTNQLTPQLTPQMTQQLSPQMAQQYRQQEFQSPHQSFPSNDPETYPSEYTGRTAPEQMEPIPHYGMTHMDMHSIPQSQAPIPPTHVVHRPAVIETYAPNIPRTQTLPQNMAPDMRAYKNNEPFIATHSSMVTPQDIIDFDDLAVDPTNESQYTQPMVPFGAHQNQTAFELADTSVQYQRGVNEGPTYEQPIEATNRLPELATDDTNDETNDATNDDSTDVDSNDTNQSFPNEVKSEIETNFSEQQIIVPIVSESAPQLVSESQNPLMSSTELAEDSNQFDDNSADSGQTDVESVKEENQDMDSNESADTSPEQTDEVIKSVPEVIETVQTLETKPNEDIESEPQVIPSEVEENINVLNEEIKSEEKLSEEYMKEEVKEELTQQMNPPLVGMSEPPVQTPPDLVFPSEAVVIQKVESKPIEDKTPIIKTTTITVVTEEPKAEESVKQNGIISESKDKKLSKNQKKKQRKKMRANRRQEQLIHKQNNENDDRMDIEDEEEVEIEYIPEPIKKDPIYFQFIKVFDKFRTGESDKRNDSMEDEIIDPVKKMMERKKPVELELRDDDERKDGEQKISKRKIKQMTRMSVSELKQRVSHPELVEMHDVTARDPLLLLHLKATRNSVPVPRHWCYKRKYLQGKRGFEKPPFKLPEFIRKTGIMEMRQALQEKEESKSLKAQMREKIRPKMGKIDIDYQKLHDAFFKWQTKPKMTIHGDLYYEGKEFETRLKEKKPGELSNELRTALGMPTGPNSQKCPPPWLIAMQRYGPPPSYPNIKIPGLNAPIPEGCSFGYHAGGWGKPPVDEYGRPLYGDVFGVSTSVDPNIVEEEVDRSLWGEMEDESEEEEESESEEEETETNATEKPAAKEVDETGFVTPAEGLITPSGLASIPTGMETPDMIELRKRKQIEAEMESVDNPALFTVIPEKKTDKSGKEMMGSTHTYDMSATTLRKGQGVDVALDPSDLEAGALDTAQMAARYEQTMKERSSHLAKEDLSDMVAEHAARQKRKKPQDTSKSNKKYQFKF